MLVHLDLDVPHLRRKGVGVVVVGGIILFINGQIHQQAGSRIVHTNTRKTLTQIIDQTPECKRQKIFANFHTATESIIKQLLAEAARLFDLVQEIISGCFEVDKKTQMHEIW